MLSGSTPLRLATVGALALAFVLGLVACRKSADPAFVGTFPMGERVQIGPMVYQVLEAQWRNELGNAGRTPSNRYLFVKLSVSNGERTSTSIPAFSIEGNGKEYPEVTEDMDKVDNWLGLLRNLGGAQTEQGWVVFDAPMAAYKLVITQGEIGEEKYAHVDIPVHLD